MIRLSFSWAINKLTSSNIYLNNMHLVTAQILWLMVQQLNKNDSNSDCHESLKTNNGNMNKIFSFTTNRFLDCGILDICRWVSYF